MTVIANLGRVQPIYRGPYNGATAYVPLDFVMSGGVTYFCIANTTGNAPPNATFWGPLVDLMNIANPPQFDASARVANMAAVNQRGVAYSDAPAIAANTTLTAADAGKYIVISGAGPAFDLPLASTVPAGKAISLHNYGSAPSTVSRQGSDIIAVYAAPLTSLAIPTQGMVVFVSNGTDAWRADGHALYALGMGDSYQDVTASRSVGVTYTNGTGKPMYLSVTGDAAAGAFVGLTIAGGLRTQHNAPDAMRATVAGVVGPGETYLITVSPGTFAPVLWSERAR